MSAKFKKNHILWVLPAIIGILIAFIIFKPDPKNNNDVMTTTDHKHITLPSTIRIASPDAGAGGKHSTGMPAMEYVYVNQLLEKEFAKDNIKIEWIFFKGAGPAINEAMANHQIDFTILGDLPSIIGKANGLNTKLLMAITRHGHCYMAVLPKHGYNSLAALKDKKIAIFKGTALQLSFNQFIKEQGFSEKDFRLINLDPTAANAALVAKQVDGVWGSSSMFALEKQGLAEIPFGTENSTQAAGTLQMGFIGTTEFAEKYPEVTQRVVNSVLKGLHWAAQKENEDQAIDLAIKNSSISRDLFLLGYKRNQQHSNLSPLLDHFYLNHLQSGLDAAMETKIIRQKFEVEAWAEPKFVQQGLKQLGLDNEWQPQN
ncbi:MAG: ABC transporter substrate-binding protein [Acinetobacter populi]|jgi:sulfonate transport system substrate-binding protein|uniref:ABC transporter substrate-binding protein n=1 Tax=Acinetobacter populi TaxID=1582270 RepID=UPI0023548817|nr:ABC transporter substrate-binding protein [Acinetobacter populi]MCH4247180.1 ABC transporter substrate-binding protein [Acinetobacter populi]